MFYKIGMPHPGLTNPNMKVFSILCLVTLVIYVAGSDVTTEDPAARPTSGTDHQLSATVNKLSAKLKTMQASLTKNAVEVVSLKRQVSHQKWLISNLTNQLKQEKNQLRNLNTYSKNHVDDLSKRVSSLETPVAFTVHFTNVSVADQYIQVNRFQRLIFDKVQYQVGGHNYNDTTGLFTAPSDGTYAFHLSIMRQDDGEDACLEVQMMRNRRQTIAAPTACPPGYTTASGLAVTWLRKGDTLSVRTQRSNRVFGHVHTTFSGLKLP